MPETHDLIQNAAWGDRDVEIRALHYLSEEGPAPLRLSCREQIADVLPFSGEDLVVESLLCINVSDRVLQNRYAFRKPCPFLVEHVLPLRDAGCSL